MVIPKPKTRMDARLTKRNAFSADDLFKGLITTVCSQEGSKLQASRLFSRRNNFENVIHILTKFSLSNKFE